MEKAVKNFELPTSEEGKVFIIIFIFIYKISLYCLIFIQFFPTVFHFMFLRRFWLGKYNIDN